MTKLFFLQAYLPANNEDVITYIYDLIKGLDEEPMVEDHTTITAITTSSNQQEEEEEIPMETDIDELCAQIDGLDTIN